MLSVVIPAYNEQEMVPVAAKEIIAILAEEALAEDVLVAAALVVVAVIQEVALEVEDKNWSRMITIG